MENWSSREKNFSKNIWINESYFNYISEDMHLKISIMSYFLNLKPRKTLITLNKLMEGNKIRNIPCSSKF